MATLWRGGEDIDFSVIGGSYGTTDAANIWVNTTAGAFRAGYARCALSPGGSLTLYAANNNVWIRTGQFASGNFWLSARLCFSGVDYAFGLPGGVLGNGLICLRDAGLVTRLRLTPANTAATMSMAAPFALQKLNAAGVATTLAATSSAFSLSPSGPDKIDFHINYAAAGSCQIYINGTLVLNYTGDMTTDGQTSLAFAEFGSISNSANTSAQTNWSEVIVSTLDTRNQSLVIRAPVANGGTDTWTTGGVAGVNGLLENDASPNLSAAAGQIQEYTLPALPVGAFAILDVTQVARVTIGATGPQHIDLGNTIAGVDRFSPDIAPSVAWSTYTYTTSINPATGVAYTTADLNAGNYYIAMRSAT